MATKIIEHVNSDVWRAFVKLSHIQGKRVGELLNEVILTELKKQDTMVKEVSRDNNTPRTGVL